MTAPRIRRLGRVDYRACADAMQTLAETHKVRDEIWLLEHPPVLTLGVRADKADIAADATLPVVRSARGGRVTCHAPGQLIAYLMLDLPRLGLGVRALVAKLEDAVLDVCREAGLDARRHPGAPGIYCAEKKLASIGLRVQRGRTSHGLALNVDPDLALFDQAVMCGARGEQPTSLRSLDVPWSLPATRERLLAQLLAHLYP